MLNARLFERAQESDAPYLIADGGRSLYAEPLDILTFSAWVEQGGIERGLQAVLEELQRIEASRLHGERARQGEEQPAEAGGELLQAEGTGTDSELRKRIHRPLPVRDAGAGHRG